MSEAGRELLLVVSRESSNIEKKRDEGVELLRCILMFGICLIHATAYSTDRCWWLGNIANCSVIGFVFISAWYGAKLKWRKVLSLVGMAAWCAAVVVGCERIMGIGGADFLQAFMKQFSSYWFLWCYIVVMMLAPIVDKALNACEDIKDAVSIVLPIMILVFVWNFISSEASVTLRTSLPSPTGFGSHTFLALVGIYVGGRFIRKWLTGFIPSGWKRVVICLGLTVFVSLDPRLGRYYSPLSLLVAACWVMTFKDIKIPVWSGLAVRFVAPLLFAVYLLHVSKVGDHALVWLDDKCAFIGYGGARSILVSVIVFVTCIVIDMPRRALAMGWHFVQPRKLALREM